jgi:hypothetical protein
VKAVVPLGFLILTKSKNGAGPPEYGPAFGTMRIFAYWNPPLKANWFEVM